MYCLARSGLPTDKGSISPTVSMDAIICLNFREVSNPSGVFREGRIDDSDRLSGSGTKPRSGFPMLKFLSPKPGPQDTAAAYPVLPRAADSRNSHYPVAGATRQQ